jgi:hypothetical protein
MLKRDPECAERFRRCDQLDIEKEMRGLFKIHLRAENAEANYQDQKDKAESIRARRMVQRRMDLFREVVDEQLEEMRK